MLFQYQYVAIDEEPITIISTTESDARKALDYTINRVGRPIRYRLRSINPYFGD